MPFKDTHCISLIAEKFDLLFTSTHRLAKTNNPEARLYSLYTTTI